MTKKYNKRTAFGTLVALFALFLVVGACSTEKNTFINRTYHSTTAKYNGYFNAKELIRIGLDEYRYKAREDFNKILPIELFPSEEDVVDFYPVVDTAISKCQKVISKHSMPTASKPSQKKSEHANWIDQNWMMIGYANYIRRDYGKALTTFEYVRKFYLNRPSTYSGQLWEAKTLIKMGDLPEATRTLQKIEQRRTLVRSLDEDSGSKSKLSKKKKKAAKEEKAPELPKHFDFELAKVKAMLALEKKDHKTAIEQLELALSKARKKEDKARLSFVLGQLYQIQGDAKAREYYTMSIQKNAPFEMSFNAKINRSVVSNLDNDEMIRELMKLAKEDRYLEFRDQIYFAMSKVELNRQDRDMAKYYLSKSVFFSLNNPRQKGVSYEKLGDLSYEEKNYVHAQRYYDSSSQVIPETYFNAEVIRNKADKLASLVRDIDIVAFEDSVQMIALMSDSDRDKFIKDVIKQLQKEEKERKEREAIRAEQLRKLQQTYAEQNQKSGSKWYFTNPKAMQEGVEDFKRIWGQRENEDYWRLSNKPNRISMSFVDNDSIPVDSLLASDVKTRVPLDDLSVEDLLSDIPLSDSAMNTSNNNLLAALYSSGMIYKEQLDEVKLGAIQFQRVIDHNIENEHNVLSAFQLYKINEGTGNSTAYKTYILNNYPNSDYANYLRDPDYFIKKKERDALALQDYLRSVTRFEQGLYYPVIHKADMVINEEPNNVYRKEYFLLKAMAMGQINRDKTSLLPVLEQAILEYPETEVAERSQVLIDLINNGVPPFEDFEDLSSELFGYDSKEYYVIVMLKEDQNSNSAGNNISNFNREFFGRLKLSSTVQLYNKETSLVLIKDFKTAPESLAYIRDFKKARRYVANMKENEIMLISRENFRIMLQQQKLAEYIKFYEKNYE